MHHEKAIDRYLLPVLIAGFALLFLLMLGSGLIAVSSMRFMESETTRFATEQQATAKLIYEVQSEEGNLSSVFYSMAAGKGRADRVCHLHEELAQPPAQTFVLERRASEFLVYPGGGIPAGMIHRAPDPYVSVLDNASRPDRSAQAHACSPQMWVIASV